MKIKRDKNNVAVLDTAKERLTFLICFIIILILFILATVFFAWLPYWVVTGKSLYIKIFNCL